MAATAAAAYIVSSQQAQVTLRCGNEPTEKVCEHCMPGERWMDGGWGRCGEVSSGCFDTLRAVQVKSRQGRWWRLLCLISSVCKEETIKLKVLH